jgi:hypothetical protein
MPWYPTLKAASQVNGNQLLGVMIDPYWKSLKTPTVTDPTNPAWFPGGGTGASSLSDPNVQAWLTRLRTDLVDQGVNFAYWDQGGAAQPGEELDWFNLLKTWKQAGISIAAESSCDLASYITGTNLFYPWQPTNDYSLLKTVTPQAKIMAMNQTNTPDANGQYWWDQATAKGFIPILSDVQLVTWGHQHGLSGAPLN